MRNFFLLVLISMFAVVAGSVRADDVFSVTYPASRKPGELAIEATFHVWIPPQVKRVRAVIVHQHGCGEGAESFGDRAALDLHWRALAAKHDAALLSPRYRSQGAECLLWCDPRNGSSATFQGALVDLAAQTGHPELAIAPWCLWGHSGGGIWVSLMLEQHPNRIVAAFCRSGAAMDGWIGKIPEPHFPVAAFGVPIMLNPGLLERDDARFANAFKSTLNFFELFRSNGAPVGFAPDPFSSHDCRNSRLLAIPFFDACLRARLPRRGNQLKPIKLARGWIGDWQSGMVKPARESSSWSWLPDEASARAFAEYVTTGKTTDRTPPKRPPTLTSVKLDIGGVALRWTAEADLESGIRQFVIYRDGSRIGLWPETPDRQTGFAQFQGISYHDTPVSSRPPCAFTDHEVAHGACPAYAVSMINGTGLESPRSKSRRP